MTAQRTKIALTGLQWTLGLVILIEAIFFVMPGAAHGFAQTHMPNVVRLVLGFSEIAGCILMLNPRTAVRGAWFWWSFLSWQSSFTFCTACTKSEIWRFMPPLLGLSPMARMASRLAFFR